MLGSWEDTIAELFREAADGVLVGRFGRESSLDRPSGACGGMPPGSPGGLDGDPTSACGGVPPGTPRGLGRDPSLNRAIGACDGVAPVS